MDLFARPNNIAQITRAPTAPLLQTAFCGSAACVALAEFVDATAGVNDLLLSGVERMAGGTYFDLQIMSQRGTRDKGIAATAGHGDVFIFGMNAGFHLRRGDEPISKRARSVAAAVRSCKTDSLVCITKSGSEMLRRQRRLESFPVIHKTCG